MCPHPLFVVTVNIPLNIHSLDISSLAGQESDLGGDSWEECESGSSAQLMPDTSNCGDVDQTDFLASLDCLDSGTLLSVGDGAGRRSADHRPVAFLPWIVNNYESEIKTF